MQMSKLPLFDPQLSNETRGRLALAEYLAAVGLPLRTVGCDHVAPCPYVGGRACPSGGVVKVDIETDRFKCPLCAPDGGDAVTYHQLTSRVEYSLARRAVED